MLTFSLAAETLHKPFPYSELHHLCCHQTWTFSLWLWFPLTAGLIFALVIVRLANTDIFHSLLTGRNTKSTKCAQKMPRGTKLGDCHLFLLSLLWFLVNLSGAKIRSLFCIWAKCAEGVFSNYSKITSGRDEQILSRRQRTHTLAGDDKSSSPMRIRVSHKFCKRLHEVSWEDRLIFFYHDYSICFSSLFKHQSQINHVRQSSSTVIFFLRTRSYYLKAS